MTSNFDKPNNFPEANQSDKSPGNQAFRVEHDSMGEIMVPSWAFWGSQTQRAIDNFPISGEKVDDSVIRAVVLIKKNAALTNATLGVIDKSVADAIVDACNKILTNDYSEHFPVDVYQTGSGTSTNMNVNEVISFLATKKLGREIRPNNEPNASQSSNDVFPSAIHIACVEATKNNLIPALSRLADALKEKSNEFKDVVKAGRTHLMDATPVTLGQEFSGFEAATVYAIERLESALTRACQLPLGGTAVGTSLNAPKGFASMTIELISNELGINFSEALNHFEAQSQRDALVELSGQLRVVALSLFKMANDVRWMSSGPACGLAEIKLPELQPGSSIMPGKVNPVVPEALCQVVARVLGNDETVAFAGSQGNFQLNVMLPVIAKALTESIRLLANAVNTFTDKCVVSIEADRERCLNYALSSASIATSLNPYIGYEKAAEVVKTSIRTKKDIKSVVIEMGLMTEEEASKALDVYKMAQGGVIS